MIIRLCPNCRHPDYDKGRAYDGRRAYRCKKCGSIWTEGMQGRKKKYSEQRLSYQFKDWKNVEAHQFKAKGITHKNLMGDLKNK